MPFQFQIQPQNNALQQIATLDQLESNRLKRDQFLQSQKDRAEIKRLSPRALEGDKEALSGIAGVNPELAFKFSEAYGKLDDQRRKKVEAGTEAAARVSQAALAARSPQEAAAIWDEGFKRAAAEIDPSLASELGKFSPDRANFTMRRALAVKDVIDWTLKNANQDVQLADPLNPAAGTRINKDKIRFAGAESGARTGASEAARFNADQRRAGFDQDQARRMAQARGEGEANVPRVVDGQVVNPMDLWRRGQSQGPQVQGETFGMTGSAQTGSPAAVNIPMSPSKERDFGGKLRDDFRAEPAIKSFQEALPLINAARDAVQRNTPQADINLVFAVAKIFDPTSVVREGEYITVRNTQALPDQILSTIERVNGGSRLTAETRQNLLAEADGRYQAYRQNADQARSEYVRIGKNGGIDAERWLPKIDFERGQPSVIRGAAGTERRQGKPETPALPKPGDVQVGGDGKAYQYRGGDPSNPASWGLIK